MNTNSQKNNETNIRWVYIIFVIMVAVQLGCIIYYFQFTKQGYHSDEMWSYGYANSYYQKDIHVDDDGNPTNMDQWLDTQILKDYIVVNEGEQFKYDSVYHNQITDLSPPFHSMVLHTICSFFPGKFSKWFSFSINIAAFLICMIYLFKTGRKLKNDTFALCCCALYGFCMGARDTYIYLRMYALCSALVMAYIYQLISYLDNYKSDKRLAYRNLIKMSVIAIIGFLTHYHMVSFIGVLTFFTCVYLLFSRQIKIMLTYGFSMLGMFVASVIIFPAMLTTSQSNVADVRQYINYNFEIRFRILSNFIMKKIFNISVPMASTGIFKIVIVCILFVLIIMIPLLIFLRNTRGMQSFFRRMRLCRREPAKVLRYLLRRVNWIYVVLTASVIVQMIVVGETTKIYGMGSIEDRYLFFLYPVAVIIGLALVYQIGLLITRRRRVSRAILIIASVILTGINIYNCTVYGDYLFRRIGTVDIEDCIAGTDCMYIRNQSWMLTTMVPTLMYADNFIQVDYPDYEQLEQQYRNHKGDNKVVAIVDSSFLGSATDAISAQGVVEMGEKDADAIKKQKIYNNIIQFLEELDPETKMEHMTTQLIFGRPMEVYLINP